MASSWLPGDGVVRSQLTAPQLPQAGPASVTRNQTFTVTADGTDDCYVAVVFYDGATDNDVMELNADGTPTQDFGVSDDQDVILPEAADSDAVSGTVENVNLGSRPSQAQRQGR